LWGLKWIWTPIVVRLNMVFAQKYASILKRGAPSYEDLHNIFQLEFAVLKRLWVSCCLCNNVYIWNHLVESDCSLSILQTLWREVNYNFRYFAKKDNIICVIYLKLSCKPELCFFRLRKKKSKENHKVLIKN
jgi:hypothetical protein